MAHDRPRLLIAEDDQPLADLMRDVLEDDFAVSLVNNGAEALNIARRSRPDLVLVDALMPKMDGFETCRAIRGRPELAEVPIIMVTGATHPTLANEAFKAGATDYLVKPFSLSQLRSRVRTCLLRRSKAS